MITLPLAIRLRRAMLIALILGLWAPIKVAWEKDISKQQDALRYQGLVMTRRLRDDLGQGLTIGVLSGMRSVVADFIWLRVTEAWEDQEWFRMGGLINLCTSLQPRAPIFWDLGGWQLAWNASVAASHDPKQPDELRRIKAGRFWVEKGLDVYFRGLENNPQYWRLWNDTAMLYQQRLKDYKTAAYYYEQASQRPNAPVYLERFPAIMYHYGGDDAASYAAWTDLWNRLTPAQRLEPQHFAGKNNAAVLRQIEDKLSIPKEKRVFPN
jgi:hypothetical protein